MFYLIFRNKIFKDTSCQEKAIITTKDNSLLLIHKL